jgi:hypothetical protein
MTELLASNSNIKLRASPSREYKAFNRFGKHNSHAPPNNSPACEQLPVKVIRVPDRYGGPDRLKREALK